ncbi:MAG: tetratricopeptide repeat protein [Saprospiraceae bacterium]|nr:tetratricopeptide repeat protein [Saprospiraceae bacterium]MDW8230998.1 tetratricopeptide repeat protein [Saprospiraceae bacterium]
MNDETARIEKYLDGQMSAEERADFEKEISETPTLKEELQLHREMRLFLAKRDRRLQLEQQLQQIETEHFPQHSQAGKTARRLMPVFRRNWAIMAVAASLALLIAAYFLFSTSLYDQFAVHPPLALVEKSATQQQLQYEAETAFNGQHYEQAEALLDQLLRNQPDDDLLRIYLGIAKMEVGKIQEARALFMEVTAEDPAIRDFAQWNLVLSYLKTGDKERCRDLARRFSPDSPYFEKAQKLLKKM